MFNELHFLDRFTKDVCHLFKIGFKAGGNLPRWWHLELNWMTTFVLLFGLGGKVKNSRQWIGCVFLDGDLLYGCLD